MLKAIPQINKLEKSILAGAIRAQQKHKDLSGGWWLWHGPESFLHVIIAQEIAGKTQHVVAIDSSMSKLAREMTRGRGRPPKNAGRRPDISIWSKSSSTLRAIIEIKRAISFPPVRTDIEKMHEWLGKKSGPKSAYFLAYSEAAGKNRIQTLENRFESWTDRTRWQKIGTVVKDDRSDPKWAWGLLLIRCYKSA